MFLCFVLHPLLEFILCIFVLLLHVTLINEFVFTYSRTMFHVRVTVDPRLSWRDITHGPSIIFARARARNSAIALNVRNSIGFDEAEFRLTFRAVSIIIPCDIAFMHIICKPINNVCLDLSNSFELI